MDVGSGGLSDARAPSPEEIARAKAARYEGPGSELFAIVEHVTAEDYKIVDERRNALMTQQEWYTPDLQLSLTVSVERLDDRHVVRIKPTTMPHASELPSWVLRRLDELHVRIHEALRAYEAA